MNNIGIIGSGNVASQLAHDFVNFDVSINWIHSINKVTGQALADGIDCSFEVEIPTEKVDLILICVNDDAIQSVLNKLDNSSAVAYTSGTLPLDKLDFSGDNLGVFYPLQTFTKSRKVDIQQVPFLIEARNSTLAQSLFDLAWKLSHNVRFADSEQRKKIHLGAVMVNNFSNHIYYLAEQYLKNQGLDEKILVPLIEETVAKLENLSPFNAQTGPARRHDNTIITEHLAMLSENPELATIYQLFSTSIQKTYPK